MWDDTLLDNMHQLGDPVADAVIAEIFAANEVQGVNQLMRSLVVNEFVEPADLPPVVHQYLAETDQLPPWANPGLLADAERVFFRYGPSAILALLCYGLPFDYLGHEGVKVLAMTGRLSSNPARRVLEVGQFVVDILQPGGLTTGQGRGRCSIQKVRLMHAAIRRLAPLAPDWDPKLVPVNQEQMAGTLMSFSCIVMDGLEKLGFTPSPAEQEAYLHAWLVAGHMLGIRPELLPPDVASGKELASAIARRRFAPSIEGQTLTKALIDKMAGTLPGDVFRDVAPFLIGYFLGKQWAGWLGVEQPEYASALAAPLRMFGIDTQHLLTDLPALSLFAEKFGRKLIDSVVFVERGGNRPSFAIPSELRQQWGVNWTS
jgi:hypothetical protein